MREHRRGEDLSAFFVGLLYFVVQWIWQMENSKRGAAFPVAAALLIGIAISGAMSFHTVVIYGEFPPLRMRMANALLFLPFVAIGIAAYAPTKAAMLELMTSDAAKKQVWWLSNATTLHVALAGLLVGTAPYLVALIIRKAHKE